LEDDLRIGYSIDTFRGQPGQPIPDPKTAALTMDALIEEGVAAEKAGFHSLRVPDRHGRTDCYFPSALQLLTVLARETERVALGAFALVNTLYPPMLVAEQCAVIDNLSRGRLYMAWARGKDYWKFFGIPEERLLGRFLENIGVIERAYGGERFAWHVNFYDVEDALLTPQPYQSPRFPFWGAGQTASAIERCARFAEAWACNDLPFHVDTWRKQADAYRTAAAAAGKKPFIVLGRDGWVADSYERAIEEFGHLYLDQMRTKVAARGGFPGFPEMDTPDQVTADSIHPHVVMGSAQQCIERLEFYEEELGVDYLSIRLRLSDGPSFEATREQITRFGEEVVAYFHRKDPRPIDHPAIPSGARW
jgi:alkanesulfonate monooxygenase SsuD/methylene tetrahydromethanopterin reductase-like flavin-dependent oxidoreductase (luciferase family)